MEKAEPEKEPTHEELYPGRSEKELEEIKERLDAYLALCIRTYERLLNDPEAYAEFKKRLAEEKKNRKEGEVAGDGK